MNVPERQIDPPLGYMDAEWPVKDEWEQFYLEYDEYDDEEDDV